MLPIKFDYILVKVLLRFHLIEAAIGMFKEKRALFLQLLQHLVVGRLIDSSLHRNAGTFEEVVDARIPESSFDPVVSDVLLQSSAPGLRLSMGPLPARDDNRRCRQPAETR